MSASHDPIRVAIVNDYDIVVEGLARMLKPFRDRVELVELEAGGVPEAAADIALFDTFASRRRSLNRIQAMSRDADIKRVVLYTWDLSESFAADAAECDIDGIVMKSASADELVAALEAIHRGADVDDVMDNARVTSTPLSEREREVLALIAQGATNREIADELYLSLDTIKTHARSLFKKLQVNNRTQAAMLAADHNLALSA